MQTPAPSQTVLPDTSLVLLPSPGVSEALRRADSAVGKGLLV